MTAGQVVGLVLALTAAWFASSFVFAVLIAPWVGRRLRGQSRPTTEERHVDHDRR